MQKTTPARIRKSNLNAHINEPNQRVDTFPDDTVNMATIMQRMRGLCTTLLEAAPVVRISNRNVRTTRYRPPSSLEKEEDSINFNLGENEQVKDAKGLKSACFTSALEPTLEENQRNVCQKHKDTTKNLSESHDQKTTYSKLPSLHQMESLLYEKAQPDGKIVSRLVHLARSKKLRQQQGKILLEGRRLISDALDAGAFPLSVFFSTVERLRELPVNKLAQASLVKVKLQDIQICPDLEVAVDMIAIFKRPDWFQMSFSEQKRGKTLPLTLICDNVRDPGNLGATLRCAAAAGCYRVLLSKGCVDVWEPKVLRAAMGAHFCLPIIPSLSWSEIQTHLPPITTVHVADNSMPASAVSRNSFRQKKAGDNGWVSSCHIYRKVYDEDEDEEYNMGGFGQTGPILETLPYHTSWTGIHTAIVIGGETHGLSKEALQLAVKTRGQKLVIPMVRGVDSLNAAMAASVLLFEGRRQLTLNRKNV